MTVSLVSTNKGKTIKNPYGPEVASFDRVCLSASQDGDTCRLPFHSLWRNGFNIGPTFQAGNVPGGTIKIYFTLDDEELAGDVNKDAYVNWSPWLTLQPGQMQPSQGYIFTVAKFVFDKANTLAIGSL